MANSGTVLGNNVIVSGSSYARLRIEWQLASQNFGANSSHINWQAYVDFVNCDAQLDNGHVGSGNVGTLYNNGGRVYNYTGNFSNHTVTMATGSFDVGHDGAGNCNLGMDGHIAVFQSGTSSGSGNWSLPTIPRYANITSFQATIITDEQISIAAFADANCDMFSWWSSQIDGGAHHDVAAGGTGPFSVTLHNLLSETTYDFTMAVRRADSGLWTTSGAIFPTTLKQANFFPFIGP